MRLSVYLADLRYNYSGVLANDCMPLGVAYMKAVMDQGLPEVRSRLFVYPDRLWDAIASDPPDVLMLSNYCWNEALSFHCAKLAKARRPDMLTVMGGPNISIEDDRRVAFVAAHPEIDVYVLGEGDFLATQVVRQFLDGGCSIPRLVAGEIPSSVSRRPDGSMHLVPLQPRYKDIADIPSPWLTGIQDEFFDGKLAPLFETNRGCPFTCTFCVQGTGWYTKVHYFDKERVKEEIEYIARRTNERCPAQGIMRIADSNYGMFERDVELSEHIGKVIKRYGYPKYIDATTGKNRPDRIIKSVEKAGGALLVYQAVQSLDENVLRNIKRQNIQLEAYEQLHVHMRGRGLRSNSDLILALPGETLASHLDGCRKLLDAGTNQVTNFQLMMLCGSELETLESRQLFSFDSRFRVLPKNFGIYGGQKVFDVEEIVVATDTLSFEDYVQARKYALASVAFWHDNLFEEVFQFAQGLGLKRSQFWDALVPAMENATGAVREFLEGFIRETISELFPTREACIEFYSRDENFARLLDGEIGDNLMHKYHAVAAFHIWPEICRTGMATMRRLLVDHGLDAEVHDFDAWWNDFHRYVELKHAWGRTADEIQSLRRAKFRYDIARWIADGLPKDPGPYRLDAPEEFEFSLGEHERQAVAGAIDVWTTKLKGLTKLITRINVAWLVRECRRVRTQAYTPPPHASVTARLGIGAGVVLLAVGSLTAAAQEAAPLAVRSAAALVVASPTLYRLTPGDVLDLKFAYNPELNESVIVRPDGRISLQMIGEVDAETLTPGDLADRVNERYARYIRHPQVAVIVREFAAQKVYVGGEVVTPTVLPLRGRLTVLQAIFTTGGPRGSAKMSNVVLIRHAGGDRAEVRKLDLEKVIEGGVGDLPMQPYDVLFVPRTRIAKIGAFVEQYGNAVIPRSLVFPYNLNNVMTVK